MNSDFDQDFIEAQNEYKKKYSIIPFLLLILFCIIGFAVSIGLFIKDINMSLTKMNENPIAHISFKYRSAQRKFLEREIWDKLRQDSPLYNGDTIRTAPLSEVTVYFNKDDSISLYEDSIIQIFKEGDEVVLNIGSGNAVIHVGEQSNGIKLRVGKMYTTLKKGTTICAKKNNLENVTSFQVLEGDAYIFSDSGENQFVSSTAQTLYAEDGYFIDSDEIPTITVTYPIPNSKILKSNLQEKELDFKWKVHNLNNDHLILEIADNKDYTDSTTYDLTNIDGVEGFKITVDEGQYYWKFYPEAFGEKLKVESKVSVINATPPELIVPANEYVLGCKNQSTNVRFSWNDMEWVTKYKLEISHSSDFSDVNKKIFETTDSYITVSDLTEGLWYWKVTPVFANDLTIPECMSETRYFLIAKDSTMPKVRLLQPVDKYELNFLTKKNYKDINFSWKLNQNASFYNIKISRDPSFNFSDIDLEVTQNTFKLSSQEINKMLEKSTIWYWAVLQGDEDGNISKLSDVRTFSVMNGSYENRLIFPPDNYYVETSRINEVSFIWKANFAPKGNQIFQVASDKSFSNILINNEVNRDNIEEATSIKSLIENENSSIEKKYYWRTIAKTEDNKDIVSSIKSFIIKPPFNAPSNTAPSGKITIGVIKDKPVLFEWNAIENADTYKFKVFKENNENNPTYENNIVTDNKIEVDFSNEKEGDYIWTVQANALENSFSTRFSGEIARNEFSIRKLKTINLTFPKNKDVFDGLESFKNPLQAKWECSENNITTIFKLYKIRSNKKDILIQTIQSPKNIIQLPRLETGLYKWIIEARTSDGFDISSEINTFEITPIIPLKEALLKEPMNKAVITPTQLKNNKSIVFKWNPVPEANFYVISIRDKNGKVIQKINTKNSTKFTFKNIKLLSRGKFSWSVEARQTLKDGTIVRRSISKDSHFEIDIPIIKEVKLNDAGELYGL